jgi:exopolysaccharide production protein ExoQ
MSMITIQPGNTPATTERASQWQRLSMWLLVIPMLFFATHGYFSFDGGGDQTVAMAQATANIPVTHEHSLLTALVLPGISYSIILCALLFNLRGIISIARQCQALTLLPIFAIASAAWSQVPTKSLLSGGLFLISTLFAYFLVLRFTAEEIMTQVMRVGAVLCFLGAIMIFVFPHYGVSNSDPRAMGAWLGLFPDRTSSAKYTVFLLSPAVLFAAGRSRWRNVIYALVLITFIVMARAVTALGVTASFVAIMVTVQVARRLERNTALFFGAILGTVCLTFILAGDTLLGPILAFFGRDLTFTGRTEIWSAVLLSIAKRPLLGYGFNAFWLGMDGESANVIMAAHWFFGYAHQGLLEIVLQLGLVGTTVFLGTFIWACRNAWFCFKYGRTVGVEWYFSILVLTVLYNVDEETVMSSNDLLSILYIVACSGLAMEAKRIRAEQEVLYPARTFAPATMAVVS